LEAGVVQADKTRASKKMDFSMFLESLQVES